MPIRPVTPTMLVSFRLLIASGVLALSTTRASSLGAQVRSDTTLALDASATVEVVGWSGDVSVTTGTDRQLRLRNHGDARVNISGGSRAVLLDAGRPRDGRSDLLELVIPRGTMLLVRTQTGDITVRGTGADVEVRTTSGDVTIEDAARVRIETLSGDVVARTVRDGVRINATSGDVTLDDVRGDVEVSATSSDVSLREVVSRRVSVKVVSGDVRWAGPFADAGRYEFSAHSGDLRLTLPRDTRATLDVRTYNGDIAARDLPLTLLPDPTAAAREEERDRARAMRDSLQRVLRDSLRREVPPPERRTGSWERDFERSVEGLVESVMRGLAVGMESLARSFDGASSRDRTRRFTLGGPEGGPLVTLSTFNGNVTIGSGNDAPRRRE